MENPLLLQLKRLVHNVLSSKYFPSRKAIATGACGIIAYYLTTIFHMQADVAMSLVTAVSTLAAYLVPPSVRDLVRSADTVITDVSGNVTDLLWKFDRQPDDPVITIVAKELTKDDPTPADTPAGPSEPTGGASKPDGDESLDRSDVADSQDQ